MFPEICVFAVLLSAGVHGDWSRWNSWGACSKTCGIGTQFRERSCNNPTPTVGVNLCGDDSKQYEACFNRSCSDGGWSTWTSWSTCVDGLVSKTRTCDSPTPSQFGRSCIGNDLTVARCGPDLLSANNIDGGWSTWSTWSKCDGGMVSRTRQCDNPAPSEFGRSCFGDVTDKERCRPVVFTYRKGTYSNTTNTLIFRDVLTDIGGGYDTMTGQFTCTIPGVYYFSFALETDFIFHVYCYIQKNGGDITFAQTSGSSTYRTVSVSAYLSLSVGDVVNVGKCGEYKYIYDSYATLFSGALM